MSNIVHALSSLEIGGAERFVLDLSEVQSESGSQVTVFSCSAERGLLVDEFSNLKSDYLLSSSNRFIDYKSICSCFVSQQENVLHIHSPWVLRYLFFLLPLLYLKGVRIIYTRHGLNPLPGYVWGFVHFFARLWVDWVTFVSDAGSEVFSRRFGWPRGMFRTIANGVFIPKSYERVGGNEGLRVGSVGRMVKLKAQEDLIMAMEKIRSSRGDHPEVHFFGDGPERDSLVQRASNCLDYEKVFFHGMELQRSKVYSSFDLLIVCSEQEGLSLAIMEAMARGVPVIATRVGDSPRLVVDGVTGYLYDYQDVDCLIELINKFIDQPSLLHDFGLRARQYMSETFSMEMTRKEYQYCYKHNSE
ncbi:MULTISPECIES: glycosyltransferase family 4 protein [unclassified Oleiphilus]|uniref:glycosyltransferase family 4 protein n=1 Tax=unclassified Oleiphilus TaxID=2631174 RepID=UPI0007C3E6FD|nr:MULTISPECIES: glycosyltransferase family 4 protein [unclassified Oleiphilus]KZY45247.1 hypothetical protein A3732_10785 [Oleiphilus sp. HI0050]KZZ35581.1 hypothetical protein A3756_15195 [Oleiphilus sp. HI0086]KZZ36761.1 hypothetical protein A3757_13125 [Oleiphilus sp. HI0117]KZZ53637.1 hypothetical protein A3761_16285 [Oleiphilus sp. HI0123]